ncbi:SURF1 family protein [Aliikangiella coralliicola]|uniref:SURF1 family protein n=1 Tax=Aliikangiella coralliicola TaxID=2592383 RepID=UPI0024823594|nr:SURF1 family protein [Aliikangiella coralliicola]
MEFAVLKYAIKYSIGRYQIRINFWFLIIFLLVQTLLNELGFWQLSRAQEKQVRIVQLEKGAQSKLTNLSELTESHIQQFQSVAVNLQLASNDILLLDNKIDNQRPGYHVLNVAEDHLSGRHLLVNRGWIWAGNDRNEFPRVELPSRDWQVDARVYPIPEKSISTSLAKLEISSDFIRLPVLDKQVVEKLEKHLGVSLEPYLLRLNSDSEAALKANWVWTNMSPEKHLAYAIQWFALALAFLIVSLIVCIKKR